MKNLNVLKGKINFADSKKVSFRVNLASSNKSSTTKFIVFLSIAKKFLNEFIQQKFPKSSILNTTVGGVPCAKTLNKIITNGSTFI